MQQTTRHRKCSLRSHARLTAVGAALAVAAVALAPSAMAAPSSTTATEISTAKTSKLGTVLVASGSVLYTLKGGKTACDAACLKAYPPVELPTGVTAATAGSGVDASKLGTTAGADGGLQVTYGGKPLYWHAQDKKVTQSHDLSDKWGKWTVVTAGKSSSGSGKSDSGKSDAGTGGTAF